MRKLGLRSTLTSATCSIWKGSRPKSMSSRATLRSTWKNENQKSMIILSINFSKCISLNRKGRVKCLELKVMSAFLLIEILLVVFMNSILLRFSSKLAEIYLLNQTLNCLRVIRKESASSWFLKEPLSIFNVYLRFRLSSSESILSTVS